MRAKERNDLLHVLVQDYAIEKQNNVVFNRENAEAYSFVKGKLIGALTVLDYEMVELQSIIVIKSRSGKKILHYRLDN